jgi:hypothetical protein
LTHVLEVLTAFNVPDPTVINSAFCIYESYMILTLNAIISLNGVNQLNFVMVKCGVFFAVRTELLNII